METFPQESSCVKDSWILAMLSERFWFIFRFFLGFCNQPMINGFTWIYSGPTRSPRTRDIQRIPRIRGGHKEIMVLNYYHFYTNLALLWLGPRDFFALLCLFSPWVILHVSSHSRAPLAPWIQMQLFFDNTRASETTINLILGDGEKKFGFFLKHFFLFSGPVFSFSFGQSDKPHTRNTEDSCRILFHTWTITELVKQEKKGKSFFSWDSSKGNDYFIWIKKFCSWFS